MLLRKVPHHNKMNFYIPDAPVIETPSLSPPYSLNPHALSFMDSAYEILSPEPTCCAVCMTQSSGSVRRASDNTIRCQEHRNQCAYCRSPECADNVLLCERCSYSGAGIETITLEQPIQICLYDREMSPCDGWTCGCSRCIQAAAAFYTELYGSLEHEPIHNE